MISNQLMSGLKFYHYKNTTEWKITSPKGAKLWSPSALSGSDVITLAFRLPSAPFPGPESKNFMMVETMLRAVFTMARVLVTMLLQINCTPPGKTQESHDICICSCLWHFTRREVTGQIEQVCRQRVHLPI